MFHNSIPEMVSPHFPWYKVTGLDHFKMTRMKQVSQDCFYVI